jgi:spectinomycin phosphotransferase
VAFVRTVPHGIQAEAIAEALSGHWTLHITQLDYLPEGGGAYHWIARAEDGQRWFVTCDDLDTKPWLGSDRATALAGLQAAYQAATALQRSAGLGFVIAPVPTISGQAAVALSPRYTLALFPFVDGKPGLWGEPIVATERASLIGLLAELHQSTRAADAAPQRAIEVPGRLQLEAALGELAKPWNGGPFSEPTRRELASHAEDVAGWLATFDGLASRLSHSSSERVVTHGEPHPGNLIRTRDGIALVDWDTVALDRPERDLWMLSDGTGSAWATYRELTGKLVDPDAVTLFRLTWTLSDLAAFTTQLRASHDENADTHKAWTSLRGTLASEEPSPYGEPPFNREPKWHQR